MLFRSNYFQTKEEIFLALFQREYEKWIEDLNKIYEKNERLRLGATNKVMTI